MNKSSNVLSNATNFTKTSHEKTYERRHKCPIVGRRFHNSSPPISQNPFTAKMHLFHTKKSPISQCNFENFPCCASKKLPISPLFTREPFLFHKSVHICTYFTILATHTHKKKFLQIICTFCSLILHFF